MDEKWSFVHTKQKNTDEHNLEDYLRKGDQWDFVAFDPDTVIDRATFEKPAVPSEGILMTLVAGTPVWQNGRSTGARPGRALRRAR